MVKYRSIFLGTGILSAVIGFSACTKVSSSPQASVPEFPVITDSEPVVKAINAVDAAPQSAPAYVQLAGAYITTARRTGNFYLNSDARRAVTKALQISPNDRSARQLQGSLHLTFHEFAEGLKLGEELYAETPDAVSMGIITDAHTQLGNYPEAVTWAQKMVDAKPNSSSYSRAALLRAMHGDTDGAVELYKLSARTADPADKEAQSWSLSQLGDLYWRNGRYVEAERVYDESLSLTPNYNLALLGKGRTRAAKGDLDAAAALVSAAAERSPHSSYIIFLADIKKKQGNETAAERLYELANNPEILGDPHDAHRIALMWADHGVKPDEALAIAEADYADLKDVYAADILAWCLYKKGRHAEAREKSREALRINTKDAVLLYHAGMIENALGNRMEAKRFLKEALDLNRYFDLVQASTAEAALDNLQEIPQSAELAYPRMNHGLGSLDKILIGSESKFYPGGTGCGLEKGYLQFFIFRPSSLPVNHINRVDCVKRWNLVLKRELQNSVFLVRRLLHFRSVRGRAAFLASTRRAVPDLRHRLPGPPFSRTSIRRSIDAISSETSIGLRGLGLAGVFTDRVVDDAANRMTQSP